MLEQLESSHPCKSFKAEISWYQSTIEALQKKAMRFHAPAHVEMTRTMSSREDDYYCNLVCNVFGGDDAIPDETVRASPPQNPKICRCSSLTL